MTDGTHDVDGWLDAQSHELTDGARALRATVLAAVPDATESVKWKAPNFALEDDFATFNMRRPGVLQLILHTGAKPKPDEPVISVDDLGGRLTWAAHNRAIISFTTNQEIADSLPQLRQILHDWASHL